MIPSFQEMIEELNQLENVQIHDTSKNNEWEIIVDSNSTMIVNSLEPSDDFLNFYVNYINASLP